MTKPEFFATPGYGDAMLAHMHFHQAMRIGDRIEISGQGGWDENFTFPTDLGEEIARTFDNVERTLATAGATLRDVVSVDSYHVPASEDSIGEAHTGAMIEQLRTRIGEPAPIWTQLAVPVLGAPRMRVEIRVTAIIDREGE